MSMTLFDDELTLPGVITQVVPDYSSGYDTSAWGTTESVTIIGTAFNGPVGSQYKLLLLNKLNIYLVTVLTLLLKEKLH